MQKSEMIFLDDKTRLCSSSWRLHFGSFFVDKIHPAIGRGIGMPSKINPICRLLTLLMIRLTRETLIPIIYSLSRGGAVW